MAHGDQGEREFLIAALNGWGHHAVGAATVSEALDRYRRGGLQAVLLDRTLLGGRPRDWRTARQATPDSRVPMILLSTTPHEDAIEQFGREEAIAVLVPPLELRALRAAVRAVSKECV